ncbi:MAG: glutamate--tRNA ligase [Spirochaetes bacterium]|nr:glutamate--tRNA ligase [Spirochaetota bacterium]
MRVRFAPSPTGFLHVGNARTAVLNYLFKKKYNATYILRIEDTDMERSTKESEQSILNDLQWLGIQWDEGPDCGGSFGPYRQSERFTIYQEYTEKLLASGNAYHCYCSQEELDAQRQIAAQMNKPFVYPGTCRNLTLEQKKAYENQGRKPTVRFRVKDGITISIDDHIKGKVVFNSENIGGDFIIVRSDGVPVYNYIVIIDDTLMNISHVIRGEDHLPNTPKQILIAMALDLPVPHYAHMPLLLGPDRTKLSKRHGITSVAVYREQGYLPQALFNYLALLGWTLESGEEIAPIDTLVEQFELSKIGKSSAIFDFQKLKWMNSVYLRSLPIDQARALFYPYIENAGLSTSDREWLNNVIDTVRGNCEIASDIVKEISLFYGDTVKFEEDALEMLSKPEAKEVIKTAHELLHSTINENNYSAETLNIIKQKTGLKGKMLFMPFRAMVTGRLHGPELDKILPLLGFERFAKRIEYCYERFAK